MNEQPLMPSLVLVDTPVEQYCLVYGKEAIGAKRMAVRLQAYLREICGVELLIRDDTEKEEPYEILLGMTNRTRVFVRPYEYVVAITNRKLYAAFHSMFAEDAVLHFLKSEIFTPGKRKRCNGDIFVQDVRGLLRDSQKNAMQKQGDFRVMTANICGSYRCCEDRMALLKTVFTEYAPDAILCQESGPHWRENENYLCNIMWPVGYREARAEGVLNDNYTPVFYDAKRFYTSASGYHLFSGENNSNSKSVSWAVLKSHVGDMTIGVFSTHFYWTGDVIGRETRKTNAKELAELIHSLQQKYGCLFVGGGDMNCTCFDPPYQILTNHGFVDCHYNAKKHTDIGTEHTDPIWDEHLQMLVGCDDMDRSPEYEKHRIDYLFTYGPKPTVLLNDVISDEHALAGTDHALVFADIQLK